MNQNRKEIIPIFFSCDDNYVPFLAVTIRSIIDNANPNNQYDFYVLNAGFAQKGIDKLKKLEQENVTITFVNVSEKIKDISKKLDEVRDYYTQTIFYRIFIASLFPNLHKAIYLDCDIVVLSDISEFYHIDIEDKILGVIVDDVVSNNEDFKIYVKEAVGVEPNKYFNSGVLLMNLDAYRENNIEESFVKVLTEFHFSSVAPDQDYLNFFCYNKVKYIDKSWNRMPVEDDYEGELNLIHYNMFMKPWRYEIKYQEFFWEYAKKTAYYDCLVDMKANYSEEKKRSDLEGVARMVKQAYDIINSKYNLNSKVKRD